MISLNKTWPSLFISHGAPTLALDETPAHRFLAGLGKNLGKPRAVLVISAHWETRAPRVTGAARPDTIHDFYGFPDALYQLGYPAPGAPELAAEVGQLLRSHDLQTAVDPARGLDHGVWVPLMLMYPQADVPVVQLALQTALGPEHHLRLGERLAPLRERGVLIIGSGGATHNLREYFHASADGTGVYQAFADWLHDTLSRNDREALRHYRTRAPDAARNHPTEEHFLPLLVAVGAGGRKATRLHASFDRSLAMDAYAFAD